jgi:hypothetical protein
MNKYLLLQFDSAGLFRRVTQHGYNSSSKDFVFDVDGNKIDRDSIPSFIEPITPHQVSNMIHVIFNQRPVPTLRKSYYKKNEYYWNKALNSYIKINTIKNDFNTFPTEKMRTKKSVNNSWSKHIILTWELIRYYINDNSKYDKYTKFLSDLLNTDVTKIPYEELINIVHNQPIDVAKNVYNFIKNLKLCDGLCYAFGLFMSKKGDFNISTIDKTVCIRKSYTENTKLFLNSVRVINSGIADVSKLSGNILVPVNDIDIEFLKNNSSGTANILDDGFVWIKKIINEDDIDDSDYTLISTISTEMSQPYNNRPKKD